MKAFLFSSFFLEIFNPKVSILYIQSYKIAAFEAEKDNTSQTVTDVKVAAFSLFTSFLQKPYER